MVAPTGSTALIEGETDTGKELIDRAIHQAWPTPGLLIRQAQLRSHPASLLESERFGREKIFSGAVMQKPGPFEAANGIGGDKSGRVRAGAG
jgi:transcriptional regulator with GAF, ATPase, and Fis domain